MEFEKFKKHIDRILNTREKEEKLSKCIEENLATLTYCIVDLSSEVCTSVEELLADYYDCYYEIQGKQENDISWWIYEDEENRKFYIQNEDDSEEEIDLRTTKQFWEYLEREKERKLKNETVGKTKTNIDT